MPEPLSELSEAPPPPTFKLQKLSPKHKEALSLVAQGLGRTEVGGIVGFAPEYISWLVKQEVCQHYLQEIMAVVDYRLAALTEQSVDAIADVLKTGSDEFRLKAAKVQLEAVGRIGAGQLNRPPVTVSPDHLQQLADRLVSLIRTSRTKGTSDEIVEAQVISHRVAPSGVLLEGIRNLPSSEPQRDITAEGTV